jgi:hypothetical protein
LLIVARWMLNLESSAVVGLTITDKQHRDLERVRELIADVDRQAKA